MKTQSTRTPGIFLALLLVASIALLPLQTAVAAPRLQDAPSEPTPLLLGQYVDRSMVNGETADYLLSVPEAAAYEIGIVDENEAIAFDLVVTDAAGNELFNDIFGSVNLELEPGDVLLQFEAVDNAQLEFAVLGNIGDMTTDVEQPGTLPAGGIFFSDDISDPVYAIVSVPETPYPQQVTIYFEPGEEDSFYISAEGEDIGYLDIEASQSDLLRFWTHGGDFLISAEPFERRSQLQLIPFLSGPPATISVDEPFQDAVIAGESAAVYALPLETTYDELSIEVEAAADEVDITMVDRLYDGDYVETSLGEPSLSVLDVLPGEYYVIVDTFDPVEEDLPVTIFVTGSAGAPVETLEGGTVAEGAFEAGDEHLTYFLDVDEPGTLVSLALASDVEASDFDLEAGLSLNEPIWSTFSIGSDDRMSFVAPAAGRYYVRVLSNGGEGPFTLTVGDLVTATPVNLNDFTWGTVEEGAESAYRLEIPEGGRLVSIALVGPQDSDLDLGFAGYDEQGNTLAYDSGFSLGSAEIVSAFVEEPGTYEVAVSAEFSEGGDFVLLVRVEDPNRIVGQWASEAVASSQYGDDGYSPSQATGAPDTPEAGDYDTAWAPEEQDAGEETLELTYAISIVPHAVDIYESYNPGAVTAVQAYNAETDEWVSLWEGEAGPVEELIRVFSPEITVPDFATNSIRLVLDTEAVEGWNEIDAVEMLGRP